MNAQENGSSPWYQNGLRFTCTRCGHCCTGQEGYVWVTDADVAAIASFRKQPIEVVQKLFVRPVGTRQTLREKANLDCVFYDAREGCTIYAVRPAQCRSWPFWESNLRTPDAWQRTCAACPGSGQGELIPVEEITRRARMIRL